MAIAWTWEDAHVLMTIGAAIAEKSAHKQRGKAIQFRETLWFGLKLYVHPPAYARLDLSNQIYL